jgi:Putative Ig domain
MKKMLMAIAAASVLLLGLLGLLVPYPVSARDRSRTPTPTSSLTRRTPTPTSSLTTRTPTPTGSQVTPTPTSPQATLTLQPSTTPPASATPQPLTVITAGFSCTNGVCTLGPGNVGTFFNEYVTSSGGQGPTPYTWKLVSGSLPSGLSIQNFGVYSVQISGTPKQTGTSTFTLQVTDGARDTAQQAFSLTIDPPLPLVITSGTCCSNGTVGTAYHTNFFAAGGVQPYTWSIISGQLPPGLKLDASAPAGISGTPTTVGTFTFTVAVTDSTGTRTTEPGSITIQP